MIQTHPTSVVYSATGKNGTGLVHSGSGSPFSLETVSLSVLRLTNSLLLNQAAPVSVAAPQTVETMQQLIEIIRTLHSTALTSSASSPGEFNLFTPEKLVPYVSEEAYEVLEALQSRMEDQRSLIKGKEPEISTPAAPFLLSFQALIPSLLWSIARSSYLVMQLIEGISVQQYQADGAWLPGMVRLVVMLAVKTPTVDWCFDLVTGCPPNSLLDQDVMLKSDENWLPIWRSLTQTATNQGDRVENQLQELSKQVQAAVPSIKPFLDGEWVDLLHPEGDWQTGQIQLRFGFEFTEWESEFTSYPSLLFQSDLVEAELLEDEAILETCSQVFTPIAPVSQVSVVELPRQPLAATTLIRLTEQKVLERYSETIAYQQILDAIAYLKQHQSPADADSRLLQVVSKASEIVHRTDYASDGSIHFHQPVLLMEELMPKLLWQLTRSSYEVTQFLGGIEASLLQPGGSWKQGTLRLLAALQFQASERDFAIDLATGRPIKPESVFLQAETVCQICTLPTTSAPGQAILCQQLSQAKTLISLIKQEIQATTPEIQLLMGETQVEWLEDGQDWQQGTLQLKLGLEFIV